MEYRTPTFAEWLTGVVQRHELSVLASSVRDRVGTWSERLQIAMGEGREYDSYLRRVANGRVAPGSTNTYRIGRGLRSAGLDWCSGGLALMRNPRTFKDLLAVIDLAARHEEAHAMSMAWYFFADKATVDHPDYGSNDDEFSIRTLNTLAEFTNRVDAALDSAFDEYDADGLSAAHGFLGAAYLITRDKRLQAWAADIRAFLLEKWIAEVPPRHRELVANAARLADMTQEIAQQRLAPEYVRSTDQRR